MTSGSCVAMAALAMALPVAPAAAQSGTGSGASHFIVAPADPRAVTVRGRGDGIADDTPAIQAAIDAAEAKGGGGIVFLPAGRYRLTRTVYLWPGVRLFGTGRTRPVLVLAPSTPGYQRGVGAMVSFTGNRPGGTSPGPGGVVARGPVPVPPPTGVPADPAIADANSGTFYSAMSNVDWEIGEGNPAAVAVRQHAAQHAWLTHMTFRLGSALAGVYQVGNLGQDLHFHGGRYGILTEKPSPAWSYTLLDSSFTGQRDAAIREHEAGLTLVNTTIRDVPVGIEIDRGYGDWFFGRDVRFENVRQAGIVISNEGNVYTQIGFDNAVATGTPVFARFRDSGKTVAGPGARYRVREFTYGLTLPGLGATGTYATKMDAAPLAALPRALAPAIRALPPTASWTDVRTLGVRGDNVADDTAAIQRAIDTRRVLYFPAGFYRVSETLRLRPDTVLIGLHPSLTQIVLADDSPGFRGVGSPRGLIESARGGSAIVSGLGLDAGGINPRAAAMIWRAGAASLVDDVKFQGGGHGTNRFDGSRVDPYNADHSGDSDPRKRWDAQPASLWVTDGGGGTFNGLWTPSTFAQAGLYVSDTGTPGHVYQMSAEHHRRAEIVLDRVRNWQFLAPQTEEEAGEGRDTVSLEVRNSRDLLFANYHGYRVTRTLGPAPAAITLINSTAIRFRNVHVNAESGFATCDAEGCGTYLRASKYPYANAIVDRTRKAEVREREFAVLDVTDAPVAIPSPLVPVQMLAGGFGALGGGAVDKDGRLYFIDRPFHRIHRWSEARGLSVVSDQSLDPVNLAVDRSGDLLVLSSAGADATVYSLSPDRPDAVRVITPTPVRDRDGLVALPGSVWNNGEFRDQYDPATDRFTTLAELFARDVAQPRPREYVSPDGSLALPAYRVWKQGPASHLGWCFSDTLDTYGLRTGRVGERVPVVNASEARTYTGLLGRGGAITDLKPLAPRGGESVATGPDGRVYIANGQVFVYGADGTEQGRIDVPERPLQLLFGGTDGRTLFILSHHGLYAARP